EGYRKLSQRFQLSVSIVRNIVRKWKTTGTVQVKARSGRPRKISQSHCASFNYSVHFTQGDDVWESDAEEAFSLPTSQTEPLETGHPHKTFSALCRKIRQRRSRTLEHLKSYTECTLRNGVAHMFKS
ncbi:hypothetical protein NFI96_024635, partial [Prochilodus magdalenae]